MNFRMIWLGSDDDPNEDRHSPSRLDANFDATPRIIYAEQDGSIVRCDFSRGGRWQYTSLTNFVARITEDVLLDDGEGQRRAFSLEANLEGCVSRFQVPAAEFGRMNWVLRHLGPRAIVFPGQHQHARAAIQQISRQIRQERIFTHLGWTKYREEWLYLHNDGAEGRNGLCSGVAVQLPSTLRRFALRRPSNPQECANSIRSSFRFLSLAPDRISIPLFAAIYRAPFGNTDFSLYLSGKTGVFKTALAALAQQHFGAGLDAAHLPGHFASTANALEALAFDAKDALLVIDDFAPTGRTGDERLESVAERLFRAAGNHQGRCRMSGNGQVKPSRPPRALLLATGEDVPKGHSIRARLLIISVESGQVDLSVLTECQRAADNGEFVTAMGAYVCWIAQHHEEAMKRLKDRAQELRNQRYGSEAHARIRTAIAELQSGFEVWLHFGLEMGAIDGTEHAEWTQRSKRAFLELALQQARYHTAVDPVFRFIHLLQAAIANGRAHLADRCGLTPKKPEAWGWRWNQTHKEWLAQGMRIGWTSGGDVFLEPALSYQLAQELAGSERLPISQQTLHHRLRERGILASVDRNRQMVQVRRTLGGAPRQVLHLKTKEILSDHREPGPRLPRDLDEQSSML